MTYNTYSIITTLVTCYKFLFHIWQLVSINRIMYLRKIQEFVTQIKQCITYMLYIDLNMN